MKKTLTGALLAVVALASCISTSVARLTNDTYDAIDPVDVEIFYGEEDVPANYKKLAVIYASGSTGSTDQAKMLEKVRQEAAALGANGVIVGTINEASQAEKIAGTVFGTGTRREGEMFAIRVFYDY